MTEKSDYNKLVDAGINTRIAAQLCNVFKTGKLRYDDLNLKAVDALKCLNVSDAIQILKVYAETVRPDIGNRSLYLCGMIEAHYRRHQGGPQGEQRNQAQPQGQGQPGRGKQKRGAPGPRSMGPPRNQAPNQGPPGPRSMGPLRNQPPNQGPPPNQSQFIPPLMPQGGGRMQHHGNNYNQPPPNIFQGQPGQSSILGNYQGNQGYPQSGGQGFGLSGGFSNPPNMNYGPPGNQGFGQGYSGPPGNQGFGQGYSGNQQSRPNYQGPPPNQGNQGFGPNQHHPSNQQGQRLPQGNVRMNQEGQFQQPDNQKPPRQRTRKKKSNDDQHDPRDQGHDFKSSVDEGFEKLKSLLTEEPANNYRRDSEDQPPSQNNRGRAKRGRGRGQQGQHFRKSDSESEDSEEDEGVGNNYGSLSNLSNRRRGSTENVKGQRGNRNRGRGRGSRGGHYQSEENISSKEADSQRGRGQGKNRRGRGQRKDDSVNNLSEVNDSRESTPGEGETESTGQKPRRKRNKPKKDDKIDEQDVDIPDVDDSEVFKFIVKEFEGGCTFDEFLKKCDLFPLDSNIPMWFQKHIRRFHIFRDKNQIVYIQPFYRDARICTKYNNKNSPGSCDNQSCEFFHICRRFVRGNCKEKECVLSHSFRVQHNSRLKQKLGISDFTDSDIKVVLNCNNPSVCVDYTYSGQCKVPNSEKRCPHLHLCCKKLFGKCPDPCKDKKTHSIDQWHNKWVLTSCHMRGWPAARVFRSVYVPPRQRKEVEDDYSEDSDVSGEDEDDGGLRYNSDVADSSESLSSVTSDRSRSTKNLADSFNDLSLVSDPVKRVPPSRKDRFKSTEDIKCGIVGKDDQKPIDLDDDENIRERERILMEQWQKDQEQRTSSQPEDTTVKPKPALKPKPDPYDPKYQERNPKLLNDDADNKNICHFVIQDQCKTGTCKSYHLTAPYLWQIKTAGKWLSFIVAENEIIEKSFCDLDDVVSTEMLHQRKKYSYHIWFNKMKAVIFDIDGQTASGDDLWCDIRRLSTGSFADKKMTVPCYLTQWRWYFKDDSKKWNIYERDVFQFTLEKKYLTKQKTFLFSRDNYNFTYRMDFQTFIQTNLNTDKDREVLRRPLFVTKEDVKNQKFPENIPFPSAMSSPKPMHFNTWDCAHDFELIELDQTGKEYKEVLKSFQDTMDPGRFPIKHVYRVQNRKLWNEYDTKRKLMIADAEQDGQSQGIDERDLYHGTDSLKTCRGICINNFDFRISGKNATLYGAGSYFAVRAKMSHSYTKADSPREPRFVFRSKVLVGNFTQGNPSLTRPPEIPGKFQKLYDSCVDKEDDPTIFVIFASSQCYPEYLFMYTDNETIPPVYTDDPTGSIAAAMFAATGSSQSGMPSGAGSSQPSTSFGTGSVTQDPLHGFTPLVYPQPGSTPRSPQSIEKELYSEARRSKKDDSCVLQ